MKTTKDNNLEWFFYTVDGEPQAQASILSSILGRDNSQYYKDFDAVCSEAGLYPAEISALYEWMAGGIDNYTNEINRLLGHFQYAYPALYEYGVLQYYNKIYNVPS